MKSLFVRFYVFVLISFLFATFIGDYIRNQSNIHDFREDYKGYARFVSSSIAREYSYGRELEESIAWWSHAMGEEISQPLELISLQDPRLEGKKINQRIETLAFQMSTLKDTQLIVAPFEVVIEEEGLKQVDYLIDKALLISIVDEYADEYKVVYYLAYLITFICLATSVYLVSRIAYRYLQDLKRGVQSISSGDYSARIKKNDVQAFQALSDDISEMAKSLEAGRRQSEVFNAAIGHELKTPLTKMRLAIGLMEREQSENSSEELVSQLNESVGELEELTDLVLKLSRVQLGKDSFVDAAFSAKSIVEEQLTECPSRFIEFSCTCEVNAIGDPQLYELVFKNLFGNALKYSDTTIRVGLSDYENGIRLMVEDDGPGLVPEQYDMVFVPFYRADSSRSRHSGGYGLGLAIVAEIITLSNAEISVDRSSLGGASFTVVWPAAKS